MTQLRDYQLRAVELVRANWRNRPVLMLPTGCHRKGQRLLRADGRSVLVEEVAIGDQLMGPGGTRRVVVQLARGHGRMARVVPVKGEPFVVNEDHILTLVKTSEGNNFQSERGGRMVDVRVGHYVKWSKNKRHLYKLVRSGPAKFGCAPSQPDMYREFDPYLLGALLGDGTLRHTGITSADPEIRAMCYAEAERWGLTIRVDATGGRCPTYLFSSGKNRSGENPLAAALRALGLHKDIECHQKFIPWSYKHADLDTRLAVLAGLIDTDGSLGRAGYDFISKSLVLSNDVAFLARSAGLAAYVNPCEKRSQNGNGGTYYRVSISGHTNIVPCRIARKRAPQRQQKKDVLRTGFTVEWLPDPEDFYGFTLDGDGRYLLDDFTITHNSGKTVVASAMIHGAAAKGSQSLFLVHRRELVAQAVTRLADWGVDAGVIAAGWPESREKLVQVASIPTLIRREYPPARLVIVDECAHARSETWEEVLDHYKDACIVGLSATPYRLDGRGLGKLFGTILSPVTVAELCEAGVLIEPRVFAPPGPNLEGVRVRGGEFDLAEVEKRMEGIAGNVVDHWLRHAQGMRTVAFCVSIEHSRDLCERFAERGIAAEHIDGTMSATERDAILARLADGTATIVSNCMVLGEGWDLPSLRCAILARPTASLALHRQQIGRIMRACEGKDGALVLDHAGNTLRHGMPTDEVEVSLEDKAVATPSNKTCPACFCVCRAGVPVCPECGYSFAEAAAEKEREERELVPVESSTELVEFRKLPKPELADIYRSLVARANAWNNRLGWARHQFKEQHGDWPSAGRMLGRIVTNEIENEYQCSGYEGKPSQWGEKCGRCFRERRCHEDTTVVYPTQP